MSDHGRAKKVIIMGAGPAGLTAAWKLAREGVAVEVVELEDQVGGLCRSVRRNGYIFDLGGHRFISKYKTLLDDVRAVMGEALEIRPRKSTIRLNGQYFAYPLDAKDLVTKMSPLVSIRCLLDYLATSVKNRISPRPPVSLEDWVVSHFGRSLYEIYFGPYSAKLWGVPPDAISADWAGQRISLINLWDVLLRLLGKRKDPPVTYATEYFYPVHGIGQIAEKIAEEIVAAGGVIRLGAPVVRVTADGNSITGVVVRSEGREVAITGDFYVSTIPLPDFIESVEPAAADKYRRAAAEMRFRSLRFLNLCIDRERVSDNTWIYIPEHEFVFFRIQEPRNWSPTTVPPGKTSLILEIACTAGDELWNADDASLVTRAVDDLAQLGFDVRGRVTDAFSTRVKHAYPIYSLDYMDKLRTAFEMFMAYDNLAVCGRQGLYRYNNMDHSMMMGAVTAEHILNGTPRSEILKIACEREVFETHAISSY